MGRLKRRNGAAAGRLSMRVLAQLNNRERVALIVCATFIVATVVLTFIDRTSLIHATRLMIDPNYQQLRYTGTIVTPDHSPGMCRFVQYDNRTSEFRNTEIAECFGRSGGNSPFARLNSLRESFKK
jgi:hypothetical protein